MNTTAAKIAAPLVLLLATVALLLAIVQIGHGSSAPLAPQHGAVSADLVPATAASPSPVTQGWE